MITLSLSTRIPNLRPPHDYREKVGVTERGLDFVIFTPTRPEVTPRDWTTTSRKTWLVFVCKPPTGGRREWHVTGRRQDSGGEMSDVSDPGNASGHLEKWEGVRSQEERDKAWEGETRKRENENTRTNGRIGQWMLCRMRKRGRK